jgi:hypothetical protein
LSSMILFFTFITHSICLFQDLVLLVEQRGVFLAVWKALRARQPLLTVEFSMYICGVTQGPQTSRGELPPLHDFDHCRGSPRTRNASCTRTSLRILSLRLSLSQLLARSCMGIMPETKRKKGKRMIPLMSLKAVSTLLMFFRSSWLLHRCLSCRSFCRC